jgi:hypothetical protein
MPATKRATIYFEPTLHDALRLKAAEEETSISDIVNKAVRHSFDEDEEDAADHAIFEQRRNEPTIPFETVVSDLKRRGKL